MFRVRRCLIALLPALLCAPVGSAEACDGVAGASWSAKIMVPGTPARSAPAAGPVVAVLGTELAEPGAPPIRVRVLATRTVEAACWLRVELPIRPNGSVGWIAADRTQLVSSRWRITVSRADRRLAVWHDGRRVRTYPVDVGAAATPTPAGSFSVVWARPMRANRALGPWILPISAHSDVLRSFAGGPGRIAIHGWRPGGPFGRARSHGCVRLDDRAISWLVSTIGPGPIAGVPVDIS